MNDEAVFAFEILIEGTPNDDAHGAIVEAAAEAAEAAGLRFGGCVVVPVDDDGETPGTRRAFAEGRVEGWRAALRAAYDAIARSDLEPLEAVRALPDEPPESK